MDSSRSIFFQWDGTFRSWCGWYLSSLLRSFTFEMCLWSLSKELIFLETGLFKEFLLLRTNVTFRCTSSERKNTLYFSARSLRYHHHTTALLSNWMKIKIPKEPTTHQVPRLRCMFINYHRRWVSSVVIHTNTPTNHRTNQLFSSFFVIGGLRVEMNVQKGPDYKKKHTSTMNAHICSFE
jgi:hypothetical protein